jgi:uncharacterized coiled-coil DUF342 family protein
MTFAGLDEMVNRREDLRSLALEPTDYIRFHVKIIEIIAQLDCQAGLILKLCHACDELEKEIDLLDSVLMKHKKRIAELEAWRERITGDGR